MTPYIITVEFRLKPGAAKRFMPLMKDNAAQSLRDEPGCRRFDVLTAHEQPDRVFLYEIYDDEAAFAAHLRAPHFKLFDEATRDLIETKTVQRYTLAQGAAAELAAMTTISGGDHDQHSKPRQT
jgi:(4S)-4-hydroxy-5-phosphonooxypentane-2,3-dione isomerase